MAMVQPKAVRRVSICLGQKANISKGKLNRIDVIGLKLRTAYYFKNL